MFLLFRYIVVPAKCSIITVVFGTKRFAVCILRQLRKKSDINKAGQEIRSLSFRLVGFGRYGNENKNSKKTDIFVKYLDGACDTGYFPDNQCVGN